MPECPKCGSEHETEHAVKTHYGRAHEGSIAGELHECDVCGDDVRRPPSHPDHERTFCGDECKAIAYNQKVELVCDFCGDTFPRKPSHVSDEGQAFCSNKCKAAAYRDRVTVTCDNCGDTTDKQRSKYERYENHYCSTDCRVEHMRGMADPKWKGGATLHKTLLRSLSDGTGRWRSKRRELEEKRDPDCQMCGRSQSRNDRGLQLHHIVPVLAGGTNHEDNLMFLCHRCHRAVDTYIDDKITYTITTLAEQFAE
jgi:5-methylcytosine-specific restriction endonuclease McrA